ncbi:arylsulfatase [Amycolatopsis jejuensis]|uniref:arylsulfatase n=1 Tax=Amycolatopsis jejuensis TaxID=330084 RepID=UPI0007C4DB25|nr:arylsulfatase [Amycolatopsis jejuensis]
MTEPDFAGRIGRTAAESTPYWTPDQPRGSRPNVLLVLLDDTGWSDFGCYGSEIRTPSIDALARDGLRYRNFHVTPLCSPTRACLLTGRNHHATGMRFLADTDTGFPNSRGRVHPEVPTLPERLSAAGYGTYLVGKWHLAPLAEITPAGPYHNWPLGRGFERFYGFLTGCTDQYTPELIEDNHQVDPPADPDYHLSADLADRAIRYLTDHATFRGEQPFYLQLAFGATHAPHQAPREYVERYVDTFTKGWDATRADRLRRQIENGLTPPGTALAERNPGVQPWDELDADARTLYTHLQAAFAGFLEHTDAQLDRVLATLQRLGLRDNTLVVVCSDNGASREGGPHGSVSTNETYSGVRPPVAAQLGDLGVIGSHEGPSVYPEGWAMAGNTPFRRYKQFVDLGGVRSPLVVSWPAGIEAKGEVRTQFVHAIDFAPTVLDLTGTASDTPLDGTSIAATFADPAAATRETQYWEMLGHRAIWHRGWKAVTEHTAGTDYDNDTWRLYDTTSDFAENHDLAAEQPGKLEELVAAWWREAERNQVLPLDDRSLIQLISGGSVGLAGRGDLVLYPQSGHVPVASKVTGTRGALRITARLRARHDGVLLSSGSAQGGYSLYVQQGRLVFEHLLPDARVRCVATEPAPDGEHTLGVTLEPRPDGSSAVSLWQDDRVVGEATLPRTLSHPSFWGLDCGRDAVSHVSTSYKGEFPIPPDALESVTLTLTRRAPAREVATEIEATQ